MVKQAYGDGDRRQIVITRACTVNVAKFKIGTIMYLRYNYRCVKNCSKS